MKLTFSQFLISLSIFIADIIFSCIASYIYYLQDERFFVGLGAVLIINLLVIVFLKIFEQEKFVNYIWVNLLVSPVIFLFSVGLVPNYSSGTANNKFESFTFKKNKFVLIIHKYDNDYELYKLIDSSYKYAQSGKLTYNDTIILTDEYLRQVKIYKNKIFGFPGSKDTVVLTDRPDLNYDKLN